MKGAYYQEALFSTKPVFICPALIGKSHLIVFYKISVANKGLPWAGIVDDKALLDNSVQGLSAQNRRR